MVLCSLTLSILCLIAKVYIFFYIPIILTYFLCFSFKVGYKQSDL